MAKSQAFKRKQKQLKKRQTLQQAAERKAKKEKAKFYYHETQWFCSTGNYDKAIQNIEKAIKADPNNTEFLNLLIHLAEFLGHMDLEVKGLWRLYELGQLPDAKRTRLCTMLEIEQRYSDALTLASETLETMPRLKMNNKRLARQHMKDIIGRCQDRLNSSTDPPPPAPEPRPVKAPEIPAMKEGRPAEAAPVKKAAKPKPADTAPLDLSGPLPDIPLHVQMDVDHFRKGLQMPEVASADMYALVLQAHHIRFKETFESLICLSSLQNIQSFWYQEETARKIIKMFHGRALLADEVGMGKTIEACMVLKEYLQRGMVKKVLILVPTPLVSQWQEELLYKFGLDFKSTDDSNFRAAGPDFWRQPLILASINIAKSKKNFQFVVSNEYDLVIIDEAHHLKNRSTLNWKLANALKKRFFLMLTATPVENNLMELYNLITLLKPGQLKTAGEFRSEFMTRGDPTDPQNRHRLRSLLGKVMIRNTRAVANIDLPPRFATTIRIEPTASEKSLYERITALARAFNAEDSSRHRMLLKNLLTEAGSSPPAVAKSLMNMLSKTELIAAHESEIRAINNLCRTMGETNKNQMLLKLIDADREKKIVFVKFLATLEHLSDFLEWHGVPFSLFHGSMNNRQKDEQIALFQNEYPLLLTTEIGGEGRNLQFCHQMINYDLPWNPMKIEQRIGRIHRIGQKRDVMIYNLCAAGSVEDYILEILDKKINMFEMVIGEIDMILGRIRGEQEFSDQIFDIWVNAADAEARDDAFKKLAAKLKRSKAGYEKTKALDSKLFGENYEL